MRAEPIVLNLTRAEALVFFEWLARCDSAEAFSFAHEAEQQVIWTLEGQLEKALDEVFDPDYAIKLEQARESVLEPEEPPF